MEDKQDDSLDDMQGLAEQEVAARCDVVGDQEFRGLGVPGLCNAGVCDADGHQVFYEYYQISGNDEPDEAETEPSKEGELKTEYEGSHSPFGFVWQVASATGWSIEYILEKVNWQMLIMMLSDAPRYVDKKKKNKSAEDEANEVVGFFQSRLK